MCKNRLFVRFRGVLHAYVFVLSFFYNILSFGGSAPVGSTLGGLGRLLVAAFLVDDRSQSGVLSSILQTPPIALSSRS